MMSGYPDGRPAAPRRHRAYGVVARDGGWCVTLDDCATHPFKDREAAVRIARRLQRQADGLNLIEPRS
ncbi:DUF2188 domain-containing protein [Brevundimonas sp.]|uniref:DUF2188 domain-containing protein n=1 Tax=Brevundimonas sp. TaxID=1871086 RepID=UPI0028A76588|nr:DUF2188 domain-containing protein [Brevundimonas sp.]